MKTLEPEKIEQGVISIIQGVCKHQNVGEVVDENFCPGNYIMSQVLVSIFPQIEAITGITIPDDCYIFYDSKRRKQLSVKEASNKLLQLATN